MKNNNIINNENVNIRNEIIIIINNENNNNNNE
jgi:hypothetical protein